MSEVKTSTKFTINAAFFQEIKEDHQQLHELLEDLRRLATHHPALLNHASEFGDKLYQLCDQLALHFSLEEAYGYFEDIVEVTPHLHNQSGKLRGQHEKLFVMCRDLADQAADRHKGAKTELMHLAKRFLEFDAALKTHESEEVNLIVTAMNQDEGGGD